MALARNSRTSIGYVAETTLGTTPATPSLTEARVTNFSLEPKKGALVSEEISSDRQIKWVRHGAKIVEGQMDFSLSYGAQDAFLESALLGSWTSNVLKAGTAVKGFSFQEAHEDLTLYRTFTGVVMNTFSLSLRPETLVTGSFGMIGFDSPAMSGTAMDASLTAAAAYQNFDSFSGAIEEGGSSIGVVTSVDLTLTNNYQPQYVIGSDTTIDLFEGQVNLTGTLTAILQNATLYNKFINETTSSLSIDLTGVDGGDYNFLIPSLKYMGAVKELASSDGAVLIEMPFQAIYNSSEGTNFKITRTPAA